MTTDRLPLESDLRLDLPRARGPAGRLRGALESPRLLLLAVGTVVVLVTLPLLRGLVVRENERDALRALRLFGGEVFAADPRAAQPADLASCVEAAPELLRRLPDTRVLDDHGRLFHHGYLFELGTDPSGERVLRAWPSSHGDTGYAAFLLGADGRLRGHANAAARWDGPAHPVEDDGTSGGWCDLGDIVTPEP